MLHLCCIEKESFGFLGSVGFVKWRFDQDVRVHRRDYLSVRRMGQLAKRKGRCWGVKMVRTISYSPTVFSASFTNTSGAIEITEARHLKEEEEEGEKAGVGC